MDEIEACMLSVGDVFQLWPKPEKLKYFCLMVTSEFVYARSNVCPLVLEKIRPFTKVYVDNFF